MATKTDVRQGDLIKTPEDIFDITEQVPKEVWFWAAMGSIIVSLVLFIQKKRDWSLFVSQWSPTFLLMGLFHKLLKPSHL
ncbi:MAG: hypothetical protein ACRDHZ_03285 [Ktedonobacteraceae bacterium]